MTVLPLNWSLWRHFEIFFASWGIVASTADLLKTNRRLRSMVGTSSSSCASIGEVSASLLLFRGANVIFRGQEDTPSESRGY